jgi:hypothetical protein
VESLNHLPRSRIDDLHGTVSVRCGNSLAIGTECDTVNFSGIADDDRLDATKPHEIVPFPAAKVLWALIEEPERCRQIVHGQFALGQSDAVKVGVHSLAFESLLQVSLGLGLGAQSLFRRSLLVRDPKRAHPEPRNR